MNTTPTLPAPVIDRAALLASLTVTGKACTPKGHAFHARTPGAAINTGGRPYSVTRTCPHGQTTWHASAALAIACLATL